MMYNHMLVDPLVDSLGLQQSLIKWVEDLS